MCSSKHERLQCIFSTKPGWKSALWGTAILFRETRNLVALQPSFSAFTISPLKRQQHTPAYRTPRKRTTQRSCQNHGKKKRGVKPERSANPPKKIEQTLFINEKKPSTTTPPGPPQLCAKTSTGAHQRRISPNSAHFFEKFGAPDLPPGIIGTMGRIGLVKVAVNFQKIAWIRCPYVLGSKRNSGVGVVLLLIFFFGVVWFRCMCVCCCVYLLDFWCYVGCVLVLWVY